MTPMAERLSVALDAEVRRMEDKWFFEWHFIGRDDPVVMDDFRGGFIHYRGIMFDGTAHMVYWDTIVFYLRKKVSELFDAVEKGIQPYPADLRATAITECQSLISGFAARIKNAAIDKDRILRGNGLTFPPRDETHSWEGADNKAIANHADGLRAVYCPQQQKSSGFAQVERTLTSYKESIGWAVAGIRSLFAIAKGFFGF